METPYDTFAYSLDGKGFIFESSLDNLFSAGDFVLIENKEINYLGQIFSAEIEIKHMTSGPSDNSINYFRSKPSSPITRSIGIKGHGKILGKIVKNKLMENKRNDAFHKASISLMDESKLKKLITTYKNTDCIDIGKIVGYPNINSFVSIDKFNQHTFFTGQTGSGKSNGIKNILSKLIEKESKPKVIILDFNSEFGFLSDINKEGNLKSIVLQAKRFCESEEIPIELDFFQLNIDDQLAIIEIDPIRNAESFFYYKECVSDCLGGIGTEGGNKTINDLIGKYGIMGTRSTSKAFSNICLQDWEILHCEGDGNLLLDELNKTENEIVIIDVGSLEKDIQKFLISKIVLDNIWENRYKNEEILLVIDEAHNIAPSSPTHLLQSLAVDSLIKIAGEGRKFGIGLFLCSQQPGKIHENILSLCNNLILLQTTSNLDLDYIYSKFSQVPKPFIQKARFLDRGEALIAGQIVPTPMFIKFDYLCKSD